MKPKQIIILGIILAALALGILLKAWVRSAGEGSGAASRSGVALGDFDPARVERILIGRGFKTVPVELAKKNGLWKIKSLWDAPANSPKVEKLLRQLSAVRGELRATGKDLLKDFGIEDGNAFSVKFLGAGDAVLQDLRIGTKKDGAEGSFIRKAGSADVYIVDVDLAETLGIYTDLGTAKPTGDTWADLSLFRLDPEKVTGIEVDLVQGDKKTMVAGLTRETDAKDPGQSSWKFLRKDISLLPDQDNVVRFIATMNSVRAEKVVDPDEKKYGLEKPVFQLIVTEDNKKKILSAGPKAAEGDRYYVKTSAGPILFSLAATYFTDLNVDDIHFVKEVPASEPAKVSSSKADAPISAGPGKAS